MQRSLESAGLDCRLHDTCILGHEDQIEFRGLGNHLGQGGKGSLIAVDILQGDQFRPQIQADPLILDRIPHLEFGFDSRRSQYRKS